MAEETDLQHLLQNADQLFDENQYQEAIDLLKKFPVRNECFIVSYFNFPFGIYMNYSFHLNSHEFFNT